ncbi:MAG: nitroreductase family protein [Nanoarchaeota archaeon]
MDTLECIQQRRSIRKYKDKAVEWDNVVKILEAGRMAPSSGNIQNWRFLVVKAIANRKKIVDACFEQEWIEEAPVLIVVTGNSAQGEEMYGTRGERLYTIQNVAAAIENMLLAATSLGLGSCWVGAFEEQKIRTLLKLPETIMPHAIVTIGYADEKPLLPQKKKLEWITRLEMWTGRKGELQRGYLSTIWPKMIDEAKENIKKQIRKLVK